MRKIAVGSSILTLLVCGVSGQSPDSRDRVFYLTHTATVQQFQEVATVIRTIADIREVATDNDQKSVTVHATDGQIAMAEWLFNELDTQTIQASVPHQYLIPGSTDDVISLFYLTDAVTVQDFQEAATLVRTIANFRRAFTYNERRAYVVRGTPAQIGLAEWLLVRLDPAANPSASEYRMPGSNDDVVQVLHLANTSTVKDFQKAATAIREATQIQRLFTYNRPRAVAVRGTADQIALAQRLATDLDKP